MSKKTLKYGLLIIIIILLAIVPVSYFDYQQNIVEIPENFSLYDSNLKIFFFDVGQADSALIVNKGQTMLIDAGNSPNGELLVKYIKELGISKIDYLIGTNISWRKQSI